jgi:hypothetical protein
MIHDWWWKSHFRATGRRGRRRRTYSMVGGGTGQERWRLLRRLWTTTTTPYIHRTIASDHCTISSSSTCMVVGGGCCAFLRTTTGTLRESSWRWRWKCHARNVATENALRLKMEERINVYVSFSSLERSDDRRSRTRIFVSRFNGVVLYWSSLIFVDQQMRPGVRALISGFCLVPPWTKTSNSVRRCWCAVVVASELFMNTTLERACYESSSEAVPKVKPWHLPKIETSKPKNLLCFSSDNNNWNKLPK